MAVDVLTEMTIARPRAEVAAYAADPDNAPEWYANIESVSWKTEPPLRVGSEMTFVARFMGRRLSYVYRAVELEPQARLVMSTVDGPFPMETTYTWTSVDESTTRYLVKGITKDNSMFGVRAVDTDGNRSPVAFPHPVQ